MYEHYCWQNQNMNWLMGVGMLFNTIGNMISGRRNGYNMPSIFGMQQYYSPGYEYYQPVIPVQPQIYDIDFSVSDSLAGLNPDYMSNAYLNDNNSIFSQLPANTTNSMQDYNLVGNTLSSIPQNNYVSPTRSDYNPVNPFAANSVTPVQPPKQAVKRNKPAVQTPPLSRNDNPPGRIGKDNRIIKNGDYIKISKDIENRIKQIAQKVNCDHRDLMGLIWAESRFGTDTWNGTTAVGLIQFTQTCIDDLNQVYGLNLTKQKIARMSVFEQLDLTEKSLLRAKQVAGLSKSHRLSAGELYTINFLPGRLQAHKNKGYLTKRGENFYAQNKGADTNKDGYITKEELDKSIQKGRKYVTSIA